MYTCKRQNNAIDVLFTSVFMPIEKKVCKKDTCGKHGSCTPEEKDGKCKPKCTCTPCYEGAKCSDGKC